MAKTISASPRQRRPRWSLPGIWRYNLTPAGGLVVGGIVLSGLGAVTVLIPVYQVFTGLLALFAVSGAAGLAFRPRLKLSCILPQRTSAGQPVRGEIVVSNRRRLPAFDLSVGFRKLSPNLVHRDQDAMLPQLRAGESAVFPLTLEPQRRGLYELPAVGAFSTFPFNLFRFGNSQQPMLPLLVLPAFHPLTRIDVPLGMRYQPGGIALTSHVGESPEYIGNREYIPGEPARRLDFRSWARLGRPVVREYQEEYYCRIALVLDTFVPRSRFQLGAKRAGDALFPHFEAAVSLTASIADALSRGEYLIDLFAAGHELYVFRAGRHTAHFENVLEILACTEACREDPFERLVSTLSEEVANISTAICVFLDWDASRRQLAQTILEAGCDLKAIILHDGTPTEPVEPFEGAHFIQLNSAQVSAGGLDVL